MCLWKTIKGDAAGALVQLGRRTPAPAPGASGTALGHGCAPGSVRSGAVSRLMLSCNIVISWWWGVSSPALSALLPPLCWLWAPLWWADMGSRTGRRQCIVLLGRCFPSCLPEPCHPGIRHWASGRGVGHGQSMASLGTRKTREICTSGGTWEATVLH